MVVLLGLPPGLLDDLPLEEQSATSEMVGKPTSMAWAIPYTSIRVSFGY